MLLISLPIAGGFEKLHAQRISNTDMQRIYSSVRTPYKYGLVVAPKSNYEKFDCPTVFRKNGMWYMTYVCYNGKDGTDGRGYETWLAQSEDLLHWTTLGKVLNFTESGWDMNQHAGYPALVDFHWGGSYEISPFKGRYWMSYFGGVGTGYEAVNAPLSIGMASTTADITKPHQWETMAKPVLAYNDRNAQWWEKLTQYKSTVYKLDDKFMGHKFIMFYNAGGKDAKHPKGERIGIAMSNDMKHWKRYAGNPIFAHDTDGTITGDAQIVKMGKYYVMFYFSAYAPNKDYNAFNTFAVSRDLIHWQDWTGEDLIYPTKPYDEMFAHKSWVVKYNGTVYHFYCAVNNAGQRGIALATSTMKGKSDVSFPEPEPTGHRMSINLNSDWEINYKDETFRHDIPLNLDDYYGMTQKMHGNLHGKAIFTKSFSIKKYDNKEYFLQFEGVGTYADISLNGHNVGHYDIGRTTQTINVTKYLVPGEDNRLRVRVSHPEGITDMPWVCGGCSSEWGFSEGSQPFGIFRPVTLIATDKIRIEPFGVHIWNNANADSIYIETEVKNYSDTTTTINVLNKLCEKSGKQKLRAEDNIVIKAGETKTLKQSLAISDVHAWSTTDPYLYNLKSIIKVNGKAIDDLETPYGIRTMSWPLTRKDGDKRFLLNGKPVFINGVCEYEHELGQSHAFSEEQIRARMKEVMGAGFNAFRDAHQPHNLLYKQIIDENGILWWPQYSAHIWYDTPQFRESFKRHLIQWVKERRNSPSVMLWGLQNESTLPKEFAEECSDIIRQLDPTCGTQRLITTCNGGTGTDWNIVQNWSGTYGGNIDNYGIELKGDDQLLNGEYGAWRSVGNHSGKGYTEEKFCDILEKKIKLAESVKDSVCGQFLWLLVSHDNPGRRQPDEGYRRIDKIGPVNHKGLFTIWEQPTDGYYMYKSHYVSADKEPFVYVTADNKKYYSNCDSVRINPVDSNGVIVANGYEKGKLVATDSIATAAFKNWNDSILLPADGYHYLYRINCGGDDYKDAFGNTWMQDNSMWSRSWGNDFKNMSTFQASQTENNRLMLSPLFRANRYGRHKLSYIFPAKPGKYNIELYFTEPWYGVSDNEKRDCEGMRIFDVTINDSTVIKDLDIWSQARYGKPYKRVIEINNTEDRIKISFPNTKAGQAIISAIAIGRSEAENVVAKNDNLWADLKNDVVEQMPDSLLPPRTSTAQEVEGVRTGKTYSWQFNVGVAKVYALRWKYYNPEAERKLHVKLSDGNGVVYKEDDIIFVQTQAKKTKRKNTSITTGSQINAGHYLITVTGEGIDKMIFDALTVE